MEDNNMSIIKGIAKGIFWTLAVVIGAPIILLLYILAWN